MLLWLSETTQGFYVRRFNTNQTWIVFDHFTQQDSVLSKDTSGYCLSEGRIQAQWALRAAWWAAQLDLRLSGAYSASQRPISQRHAAAVGRRVVGELKRLENAIIDAGLMPTDD